MESSFLLPNSVIVDVAAHALPVVIVLLSVYAVLKLHARVHVDSLADVLEELGSVLILLVNLLIILVVARSVLAQISESHRRCLHLSKLGLALLLCHRAGPLAALDFLSPQLVKIFDLLESVPIEGHIRTEILLFCI